MLFDANPVIDYFDNAPDVLECLVDPPAYPGYVPFDVLQEVNGFTREVADDYGFRVVYASFAQRDRAIEIKESSGLSVQDAICFILCLDNRWTCVTADKLLRKRCKRHGIATLWTLEIMLKPIQMGCLTPAAAISAAEAIERANPWMRPDVLDRFKRKIAALR